MMSITSAGGSGDKPLRRDARRNRALILDAARSVIAEVGLDAGFDEIARRAGVGAATVYRRFPDRDDLIEALFTARIDEVIALAEAAAELDDSWAALVWFMERSVQVQADDRGLRQVLTSSARGHERIAKARERLLPAVGALLARAQHAGGVRTDVQVMDLAALSAVISLMSAPESPGLWRRYLVLLLDGLRVDRTGVTPLPGEVPHTEMFVSIGAGAPRRGARH